MPVRTILALFFCCCCCSLPQPHLDRTKLCELNDSQLEPKYISQRDALKQLVLQQAGQKVVGGEVLTGEACCCCDRQCCCCCCCCCCLRASNAQQSVR
jgi:hypothetical protein